jgi:U4/U6 small nuclear ribonucleoprotein PRP31
MAGTLADSFLADLEDLSDDEAEPEEYGGAGGNGETGGGGRKTEDGGDDLEGMDFDSIDSCSKLIHTDRYKRIMKQVAEALAHDAANAGGEASVLGVVDEGAYQLIVDCNALSVDIDNEIQIVHNFIRDKYRLKFPELESLVLHPIDYARVVKAIANEMDMTLVELDGILPNATIMVVSVTGRGLLTLVHFSAQPEPFVSLKTHPEHPPNTPSTRPRHSLDPLDTLVNTPYPTKIAYVELKGVRV